MWRVWKKMAAHQDYTGHWWSCWRFWAGDKLVNHQSVCCLLTSKHLNKPHQTSNIQLLWGRPHQLQLLLSDVGCRSGFIWSETLYKSDLEAIRGSNSLQSCRLLCRNDLYLLDEIMRASALFPGVNLLILHYLTFDLSLRPFGPFLPPPAHSW